MKYGKLINGLLTVFDSTVSNDESLNDSSVYEAHGYKQIVFTERPQDKIVYPIYEETENQIIVSWTTQEPIEQDEPSDEPSDEATEEDYIAALHELEVQTDEEENA